MREVDAAWRWLGVGVVAIVVGLALATAGASLVVVTQDPVSNCPPLGNGGALHVHTAADEVPNRSAAVDVVREHVTDPDATTTSVPPRPKPPETARTTTPTASHSATVTASNTENATASGTASATATTRQTLTLHAVSGHFHGTEQIHPQIGGGDVEHYHVDTNAGGPIRGYVVTADGDLYRVVVGDC